MDFRFSPEEERFRQEVRAFFEGEKTTEGARKEWDSGFGFGPYSWEILRKLGSRGWLTPSWPKKYGGLELPNTYRYIIADELDYFTHIYALVGAGMAGPIILRQGSETQKQEYLPRIAKGEMYLEEYDIALAKLMCSGVDLWLSTSRRPQEASGTSGMKAVLNGVPSLSVLDGWWIEGHIEGATGWSIGDSWQSETSLDAEIASLYDKLEYTILPMFYQQPDTYGSVMRSAIAQNGSYFNAQRMVAQYLQNAYMRTGSQFASEAGSNRINSFNFGFIVVNGKQYVYDVVILPDGTVREREPGKGRLGSHAIKRGEIESLCKLQPDTIVVGTGTSGLARLSEDAHDYIRQAKLNLVVLPSFQAVDKFNQLISEEGQVAALIHVTC